MTRERRRDRRRGDDGVASVELLGIIPLGLLLALIGLQVGAFMWAVTNVNEAVRQGARAQSLGRDGCAAARATLAGTFEEVSCTPGGGGSGPYSDDSVRVQARVWIIPFIEDYVPDPVITRSAVLP